MRVFLTHNPEDLDAYYGRALPELAAIATVVRNPTTGDLSTDELLVHAADCDVIVAHRATPGERALFDRHPRLLAFLRCAVDISTIDTAAASDSGVLVARADTSYVASTAELALALYLDLSRHVSDSTHDYRQGRDPAQRPGRQVRGQTAAILGLGLIGTYLAELLVALGLRVLAHDVAAVEPPAGVELGARNDVVAAADVVFPLAPANEATRHLVDADLLRRMRPGALLVNVSRGELMDENAVAAALDRGHLGGLALDVGMAPDQRPSPALAARPGVVATPHLGGLTPENADAQARSSVEQVAAMLAGDLPPRAVNAESASRLRAWWGAGSADADGGDDGA
ncbi:MAG: NAD(P)-dependent oxidoreductase [Actinomycetota bacterium]